MLLVISKSYYFVLPHTLMSVHFTLHHCFGYHIDLCFGELLSIPKLFPRTPVDLCYALLPFLRYKDYFLTALFLCACYQPPPSITNSSYLAEEAVIWCSDVTQFIN